MKKFFLVIFILLDLAVIAASAMFLAVRLGVAKSPVPIPENLFSKKVEATSVSAPTPTNEVTSGAMGSVTPPALGSADNKANANGSRKILFTYRNSIPKKVMIRADFTGWRAEPMEKDPATKVWKYMAVLEPGEYSYLFSVDDKPVRDPANKRTKKVGTTVVSSLVVGPLSTVPQ